LPFQVQIWLNGREWLARTLDRNRIAYQRRDNCFPWIANVERAQHLMDAQLAIRWPFALDLLRARAHPAHEKVFAPWPFEYYWSVYQSEWATEVMFRDQRSLAELYQRLVQHGITRFQCRDVLRFLGKKIPAHGESHGNFAGWSGPPDLPDLRRSSGARPGSRWTMVDNGSYHRPVSSRSLVLACVLLPACSFAFVKEPSEAMLTKQAPLTCTTSRAMPLTDLVIGAALGGLVFATTYAAIEDFNQECLPGSCYRPWGPALLGAFLVVSPWWISSAVGFSETHQCRKAARTRAAP
jgi:hypothetical protein